MRINLIGARLIVAAAARWIWAGMAIHCGRRERCPLPARAEASMERLWRATINSWHGLRAVARSEEAFRQELVAARDGRAARLPGRDRGLEAPGAHRWSSSSSSVVELLNTAIEKLADRVSLRVDPADRLASRTWARPRSAWRCSLPAAIWLLALAERLGLILKRGRNCRCAASAR